MLLVLEVSRHFRLFLFAMRLLVVCSGLLLVAVVHSFRTLPLLRSNSRSVACKSTATCVPCPFEDVIPFLAEHVEKSDQLLLLGCRTDLAVRMVQQGWGTEHTGFMKVVDSDAEALKECESQALADPEVKKWIDGGKLTFQEADLTDMSDICQQSVFDAIVDNGGLDSVLNSKGEEGMLKTIDHLQNAVRLGNILVCLSEEPKDRFCTPFEDRFGWVQELDGDPGELSAWIRGKSNIAATKNNFKDLGLFMYVYTNVDNC